MPNNDRKGKWQSFDALTGFGDSIQKAKKEQEKIKKPVLFPDELEEQERKLALALNSKEIITIEIFNRGYIEQYCGIIKKVDITTKEIILELEAGDKKIKSSSIINISINN